MKKLWLKVSKFFATLRGSKYSDKYLNDTNIRSAIYMSIIIIGIEIWMIIRRFVKTLPEQWATNKTFYANKAQDVFMLNISFVLLILFGVTMIVYAIYYIRKKHTVQTLLSVLIPAGILVASLGVLPIELSINPNLDTIPLVLLILFYSSLAVFGASAIVAVIYSHRGGTREWVNSAFPITLFSLVCLIFGMRVSYLDYVGGKEVICFLMMTTYVGCLLIWKPYVSLSVLGAAFLAFHGLLKTFTGAKEFPSGDEVNYITFFISLIMIWVSIYDQRMRVAKKEEELEILATRDQMTDLLTFGQFINLTKEKIAKDEIKDGEYIYLFLDIVGFKIINDQRGFEDGNVFLKEVGDNLTKSFPNGLITRQSDDHFVIFAKKDNIQERLDKISEQIKQLDSDIKPGIRVGLYTFHSPEESVPVSVEKARYACATLKNKYDQNIAEYDSEMHNKYRIAQYVVHHIDEAVEKGYIQAYFQPVVWSKDETVCSLEALARWDDEKYGFLSPKEFITSLENAQIIYKLDLAMLDLACRYIKHNHLNNLPVLPVSINFSRRDFALPNIVETIETIVNRHKVAHELIYIEITESALLSESDDLKNALRRLKEKGFSIWLDDFGSGYSSLTTLKDYDFDVLKLDMRFISALTNTEKSRLLLKSVILMAESLKISTLCEGVEREPQAEFLRSINCERLQGFLYGKPMSAKQLEEKIIKKELKISRKIKRN